MKKTILICCLALFTQTILSQENSNIYDIIFLNSGDSIKTRIARVTNKNVFYFKTPYTFEIKQISRDKIKGYEFNDEFFQTNSNGDLVHSEIVYVDGYRNHEIYRAIKDWIKTNSTNFFGNIRLEDEEHFILLGTINTPNYLKHDFFTTLSVIDDQLDIQTYSMKYDLIIRIKDDRFKIAIYNFRIEGSVYDSQKLLKSQYETRCERNGEQTIQEMEIMRLKSMITKQIQNIRNHCKMIREEDEFHKLVVKYSLMDDNW